MKYLALLLIAPALSGCFATLDGKLNNRLACTVSGDKLFVVSEYGPLGVASTLDDRDRAKVCPK